MSIRYSESVFFLLKHFYLRIFVRWEFSQIMSNHGWNKNLALRKKFDIKHGCMLESTINHPKNLSEKCDFIRLYNNIFSCKLGANFLMQI